MAMQWICCNDTSTYIELGMVHIGGEEKCKYEKTLNSKQKSTSTKEYIIISKLDVQNTAGDSHVSK